MKKIKKGSRAVAVLLLVSIYVLSGVAFNLLPPERVDADNDNEITICHATGSPENPYNKISVNKNSIVNPGNAGHGSSGINENDIIPPFSGFDGGHNWDDEGQAIYYNDCEVPNGDTGEITIVATKIICENENDLPKWASSGAPNKIEENTATDWLDGKDGCYLAPGWGFQWRLPEFDYPGDDKIGYADGWSHFDGETDSNGVTQVTLSEDDINGSNQIAVREVLQDGYIPFTHQSSGSPPSAELYCHDDIGNYDNWEWVRNFTLGGTYYCVAFNAYKSTDVEICKQDDEGNSLEGWNITLSSEEKEWEKSDETDGDGCIIFENVPYGDYVIEEEDRDGWRNVNGLGEVNIDEESNEFLVVNERVAVIKAYKIICEEEGYLPDWVKDRNFPSPSNELTKQDIFDYADNEGCEFATEEWYFEWGYDGQAERKDGDHIGSADDPNWYSFDTSAIGESPAVVIIENLDPSNKIWVRELLKDGYIPFTDHPGNSGTSESAELICHTDGFNYDNYEYVEGMEKGNVYYCLALNVPKEDPLKDIPFYESADSCPIGTAPRYLETHEISSTEPGGKEISLEKDKTYLFRALGTYSFRKQEPLWHADAGYSTKDGWGNTLPDYGIRGEDPNYAAHALLGDLGEDTGIGVIDWGDYNTDHEYEFYYEIASDDITFLIGDRYGDWFETDWQEQVGMDDNEGSLTLEIHECVPSVTIYAYKIICDDESYLPEWGDGGEDITEDTVGNFLEGKEDYCRIETDWYFQWAPSGTDNPGDNEGEIIDENWKTFSSQTVINLDNLETSTIWVREVFQDGYIPFTHDSTKEPPSAQLYCHIDVLNYDNYDRVDNMTDGGTYYCVAFNAPITDNDSSDNNIVDGNDSTDPSVGGTASSMGGQSLIAMGGSPGETITFPQIEIAQAVEEEEEEECGMYLLEFIRFGADNNPNEVRKLQMFLNEYMGENLPVTGFYDLATFQAVERFQVEHKEEVLRPWVEEGIHDDENSPTGYVFETTRRWINMLVCPELGLGMPNLAQYALTLEAGEEEIVEEEEEVEDIEEVIAPLEEEEEETEEITQVGDAGFLAATLGQFMTPEARQFLLVVLSLALLGYLGMLGYQKFLKKRK